MRNEVSAYNPASCQAVAQTSFPYETEALTGKATALTAEGAELAENTIEISGLNLRALCGKAFLKLDRVNPTSSCAAVLEPFDADIPIARSQLQRLRSRWVQGCLPAASCRIPHQRKIRPDAADAG